MTGERDAATAYVEIAGNRQLLLPTALDACEGFEPAEVAPDMTCANSGPIEGPWSGLDLAALLAAAESPPDATHVLVTCRDGYRVCLDVPDALSAVLAYRRDGDPLSPGEIRVVGPDVESGRSAKGVRKVEPVSLAPEADPTDLETLEPAESDTSAEQ